MGPAQRTLLFYWMTRDISDYSLFRHNLLCASLSASDRVMIRFEGRGEKSDSRLSVFFQDE